MYNSKILNKYITKIVKKLCVNICKLDFDYGNIYVIVKFSNSNKILWIKKLYIILKKLYSVQVNFGLEFD